MTPATRLRPGPAAEEWLGARVRELKAGDVLQPVTVVVPGNPAGLALRRRLAGGAYANVRHSVLARLAEMAGGARLAAAGRVPLTSVTEEAAIRAALRRAGGIGPQTEHRAVVVTLRSLFRDLAMGALDAGERGRLGAGSELARVAMAAYEEYHRILLEQGFYNHADLASAAIATLREDGEPVLADWGPIVVHLPHRLSVPELDLLAAIGDKGALEIGFPWLDDPVADAEPRRWAQRLGIDWDASPAVGGAAAAPQATVLMAPDAGEEVRAVVRRLLADLETSEVPLHRAAIVHHDPEPYRQLVRETLDAALLPWVGLGGKPISESYAGRGLLGLLHLQGQRFSRGSVLNWLSSLPHDGDGPSLAQWDRVSRQAGVVRTSRQWSDRLQLKLDEQRRRLDELEAEGDDSNLALRSHLRSEAAATEEMRRRIQDIERRTRPPEGGSWTEFVAWARDLRKRFVPVGRRWPAEQEEAARMVDETLAGLTAAGALDAEVSVDRFVDTLEDSLAARRQPEGRLGQGVVTGSISAIAGMSFDRVYVLGMTERAYPAAPPVDPIFAWEAGVDPLGRVERQLAAERMSYLGALSAAGSAVLCFPTHDTEQRPAYPARWLLDAVEALAGRRIGPARLRELRADRELTPWLTSLVSTEAALRHGPVMLNVAERQVAEAREITGRDGDLAGSALAARDELPLGRGLEAAAARAAGEFTPFDGNVGEVAAQLKKLAGGLSRLHPISASGVETWAACPFRYFLGRVLEVEPTERPEDDESWSISPIDRGSLVHEILDEFFRTLHQAGRPAATEPYTQDDRQVIEEIAQKHFRTVEDRGQTGYQLAWANTQSAIQLDLRTVLAKDEEFRSQRALKPEYFEQGFGFEEGWPAAEVALSDGTVVRLRGYIDRVDFGDGEAYVTDYKTGSLLSKKEFDDDPVVAGTKVQLAVYSNAVRRFLEAGERRVQAVTASYWFISPKANFARIELVDGAAADQRLSEIMGIVNEGLTAGAFPQVPGDEEASMPKRPVWNNCRFCDYDRICPMGRDQIHDRKKDEAGANLPARLAIG